MANVYPVAAQVMWRRCGRDDPAGPGRRTGRSCTATGSGRFDHPSNTPGTARLPGKQIQIVLGEAALHTRFATTDALAGQLDRLIAVAGLATVTIGVLGFETPSPVLPLAGFAINDTSAVWVETLTGEQMLDDPVEVDTYAKAFNALLAASAVGDDAVEVIRSVQQRL